MQALTVQLLGAKSSEEFLVAFRRKARQGRNVHRGVCYPHETAEKSPRENGPGSGARRRPTRARRIVRRSARQPIHSTLSV